MNQLQLFNTNKKLTPKLARYLTPRKGEPYKYLVDQEGIEWLVLIAHDQGRMMELAQAETDGKVRKTVWSEDYKNYEVMWECLDEGIPEKALK